MKYNVSADREMDQKPAKASRSSPRPRLTAPVPALTALHDQMGNRAVGQLIQAKLTIGAPDDKYEREADRIADQVMRMPEPGIRQQVDPEEEDDEELLQTKPLASQITPLVQRQAESEGQTTVDTSSVEGVLRSPGRPLDEPTRALMESRFGYDLGGVRVHTDPVAAESARSVNARAYTVGHKIVFGTDQYMPRTSAGQRLLAHELTHVVQQNRNDYQHMQKHRVAAHELHFEQHEGENTVQHMALVNQSLIQRDGTSDIEDIDLTSSQPCQVTPDEINNWPNLLSRAERGTGQDIRVELRKEDPKMVNTKAVMASSLTDLQKCILKSIKNNRAAIDVSMFSIRSDKKTNEYGYWYGGKTVSDPSALQKPVNDPREEAIRQAIWKDLKTFEGGASSINAYDKMRLTWGVGYAFGTNRPSGGLANVLDTLFKDQTIIDSFLPYGIVWDVKSHEFLVVNTQNGLIESGMNALSLIQGNKPLLGVFVRVAEQAETGQKVIDVQFTKIMAAIRNIPPEIRNAWDIDVLTFAFHINHWKPVHGWDDPKLKAEYIGTKGRIADVIMVAGRSIAKGQEESGAYIISSDLLDPIRNGFMNWANRVAGKTIQKACPLPLRLTKSQIQDPKRIEFKDKLFIRAPKGDDYYVFPSMPMPTVGSSVPANASKPNYYLFALLHFLSIDDMLRRFEKYNTTALAGLVKSYNENSFVGDFGPKPILVMEAVLLKKRRKDARNISTSKEQKRALDLYDRDVDSFAKDLAFVEFRSQYPTQGEAILKYLRG